jgi:probable rRNA maturation factor
MPAINFFSEQIRFKLSNPKKTTSWIKSVIKKEGCRLNSLNYVFCSDEYLKEINIQYLRHKTYTDIITFNYNPAEGVVEGEIYISVDRVRENAKTFKTDFQTELHRVIIHGVLHLIGFNDKSKSEKALMREKEDSYLSLLKVSK